MNPYMGTDEYWIAYIIAIVGVPALLLLAFCATYGRF